MSDEILPKRLLYGELSGGRVYTGGQCKHWENLAAERGARRSLIRKGAESCEQTRIRQAEEKRLRRKSTAAEASFAIITALQRPN